MKIVDLESRTDNGNHTMTMHDENGGEVIFRYHGNENPVEKFIGLIQEMA